MGTSIKFNVIIPTRERADVLLYCLHTVVVQDYENLNIIVSDNFSQDNTREVVASFDDSRIRYINPGRRMSMSHHWEFALGHVTDGWVMILGDDDGLLPGALDRMAQVIKDTGCLALMSDVCRYDWPNTVVKGDHLIIPFSRGIEWRNSRAWLARVMRGAASYMDLPYLYTGGVVELSVIKRARASRGSFYLSLNPDIYSAIALASVLDDYVMLKEPVAIAGLSSHSTGASGFGLTQSVPVQKFFSEENIPFDGRLRHNNFPRSASIWIYECYLQAIHIHDDFLKVKLEDQLGLALSRIPKNEYDILRKYCVEIAHRNGIDMTLVDRREKAYGRWGFFRRWVERVSWSWNHLVLSGKEFGIHNVYEASILARAVLLLKTRYAGWRFKKLFKGIRKLFGVS